MLQGSFVAISLVFHFPDTMSAGTLFEKKAYQYLGKNCRSENTIMEFDLLYDVLSVDGYAMHFQLHNGTFVFQEANPPYCSPLQPNTVYDVGWAACFVCHVVSTPALVFPWFPHSTLARSWQKSRIRAFSHTVATE